MLTFCWLLLACAQGPTLAPSPASSADGHSPYLSQPAPATTSVITPSPTTAIVSAPPTAIPLSPTQNETPTVIKALPTSTAKTLLVTVTNTPAIIIYTATPVPSQLLVSPSSHSIRESVYALAEQIGPRPAGSAAEKEAATYLQRRLEGFGYLVSQQEFSFPRFVDNGSQATYLPDNEVIVGNALTYSVSGIVSGEVRFVGIGRESEIVGVDLRGRIALFQRGELRFSDKVERAVRAGAIGVIIYNNRSGRLLGVLREPSTVPVLGISQEDGERLVQVLKSGSVSLRLSVSTETQTHTSQNVIARPADLAADYVLVGGHYDSVSIGPGANDNASGSAAVVELARVISSRPALRRSVAFALFGAEELGLIGSTYMASNLPFDRPPVAMLNFDMVGVGTGLSIGPGSEAGRPLSDIALRKALALGAPASRFDPGRGSDHAPFADLGLPTVMFYWQPDENHHTPADQAEQVDPEKALLTVRVALDTIIELLAFSGQRSASIQPSAFRVRTDAERLISLTA